MMTAIGNSATVLTPQQKASVARLDHKFVAPCCYSQVLADHMSQEALDMRNEVVAFVVAGKSEREITEYYKAKYGKIILAAPDGPWGTFAFATPPFVGVTSALLLVLFIRRSFRRSRGPHTLSTSSGLQLANAEVLARIRAATTDTY